MCAVFGGAKLSLKINDIYIGTRDSQYVTLVKDSYTSSSLIASASNGLFPLPSFFQEFATSIQRLSCLLKLSIFNDALWILHVFFQVTIEARYKPSEAWRFIIAPIFSLTVTINSLRTSLSSCGCICSIFLFSCLDFRNSESKPTSRLVFDNVCLFFCSSINWSTDFCKAGKRRLSAVLQPLFSFFWQFCWDIIQTKNLNVLTFWQSCQNKTFNENTKLPKTRLLLVGALWLVETFYSHVKKPFRFSDWLNKGANHVFTQVDSNRITQSVCME